jgi:DNA repair photolyase
VEVQCRSILNKSGIPGLDYTINPYLGCEHACSYCYADFMQRFAGRAEPWGEFLEVKINASQRLDIQLRRARPGKVILSSVTDPYQPAEAFYQSTRKCLELLADSPLEVSILTKSPLVLRDISLLRRMPRLEVGISLSTLDPEGAALFEAHAPSPSARLRALAELSAAGIATWLFLAPCLPGFSDSEEALANLARQAVDCGANLLLVDTLQLYPKPWSRVRSTLAARAPRLLPLYEEYRRHKGIFASALRTRVNRLHQPGRLETRCAF